MLGAEDYTFGDIAGGERCGLTTVHPTSQRLGSPLQRSMIMQRSAFGADFASQRRKSQVSGAEVSSFLLESACVEYTQHLAGILVGNIRNELKAVRKGANDEAIVTAESLA